MLKILHIIPNLLKGGAERLVIDIVREFSVRKDVIIRLVILENKIEYRIEDVKDLVFIIPSEVNLSLIAKNQYKINELQNFINDFKPDVIHTHLFLAEIVSRSCFYPAAKWFTHCHGNMPQYNKFSFNSFMQKQKWTYLYERWYITEAYKKNKGTHLITISKYCNAFFEKNYPNYSATLLLNAINYNRFISRKKSGTSNETTLNLINIGSFYDKKNQGFLIQIAKKLKSQGINFVIHLLGDGERRAALQQETINHKLDNNILFHGNVENVEEYLMKSHIYVHSATYEPFGLVLLEAMAAGLPVITLDGKGNRDLIEQEKNGYMIYEQNSDTFVKLIVELWNNKVKLREISVYAQQYAKQFDIKKYCEKLMLIYKAN